MPIKLFFDFNQKSGKIDLTFKSLTFSEFKNLSTTFQLTGSSNVYKIEKNLVILQYSNKFI